MLIVVAGVLCLMFILLCLAVAYQEGEDRRAITQYVAQAARLGIDERMALLILLGTAVDDPRVRSGFCNEVRARLNKLHTK